MNNEIKKLIDDSIDEVIKSDLPIGGELKYSKQTPGGVMSAVNIAELQDTISTIDGNTFQIHNDILCPELWNEYYQLDPEVRINLLRMAYDVYEKMKLPVPLIDVYLMGSISNYNWTDESDVDIHIVIDYNKIPLPKESTMSIIKNVGIVWNQEHNVTVKGHDVEINIQDVNDEKNHVTGIYSLIKDKWIRKPSPQTSPVNKQAIQQKYDIVSKYIDACIKSNDEETMKGAKKYIDALRQYGLDTGGELSTDNIVFKLLRKKGIIKTLKDSIIKSYDSEMTVDENDEFNEGYGMGDPTKDPKTVGRWTVKYDSSKKLKEEYPLDNTMPDSNNPITPGRVNHKTEKEYESINNEISNVKIAMEKILDKKVSRGQNKFTLEYIKELFGDLIATGDFRISSKNPLYNMFLEIIIMELKKDYHIK